jgi:hypothetical protein
MVARTCTEPSTDAAPYAAIEGADELENLRGRATRTPAETSARELEPREGGVKFTCLPIYRVPVLLERAGFAGPALRAGWRLNGTLAVLDDGVPANSVRESRGRGLCRRRGRKPSRALRGATFKAGKTNGS